MKCMNCGNEVTTATVCPHCTAIFTTVSDQETVARYRKALHKMMYLIDSEGTASMRRKATKIMNECMSIGVSDGND